MKIVGQSYQILSPAAGDNADLAEAFAREARLIELAARTAYKSEDKISSGSYISFIEKIIKRDHLAVIEFGSMAVKLITDRGVTHELVRHRHCSFVQESTRYCNYANNKFAREITFIKPSGLSPAAAAAWKKECENAEQTYFQMIEDGQANPQNARSVLPNCLKAEIVVRANFREWRHIFNLRALSAAAHPDIRALLIPLYNECRRLLPCVFEMGDPQ